jgi:cytidylate kinase
VIVSIDGPAGAGKSSVATLLAGRLGVGHLDTGAMYRAIAWLAAEKGVPPDDGPGLAALARSNPIGLSTTPDGARVRVAGGDVTEAIRRPAISETVSQVAAHAEVRAVMVGEQQRLMASGDWVADGRDVGSAVCPDATIKVYLTASEDERARRRHADLAARGVRLDEREVLEEVRRRDRLDSERAESPLRVPEGAVVIDSSALDAEAVVDRIAGMVARGAEVAS